MSEFARSYLTQFRIKMARAGYNVKLSLQRGTAVWGSSKLIVRDLPDGDLLAETTHYVRGARAAR
jgi:hypothetical protein